MQKLPDEKTIKDKQSWDGGLGNAYKKIMETNH